MMTRDPIFRCNRLLNIRYKKTRQRQRKKRTVVIIQWPMRNYRTIKRSWSREPIYQNPQTFIAYPESLPRSITITRLYHDQFLHWQLSKFIPFCFHLTCSFVRSLVRWNKKNKKKRRAEIFPNWMKTHDRSMESTVSSWRNFSRLTGTEWNGNFTRDSKFRWGRREWKVLFFFLFFFRLSGISLDRQRGGGKQATQQEQLGYRVCGVTGPGSYTSQSSLPIPLSLALSRPLLLVFHPTLPPLISQDFPRCSLPSSLTPTRS